MSSSSQLSLKLVVLTSLLALAACGGTGQNVKDGGSTGGTSLTAFEAATISGDDFSLGDHLGKDVVLMSFWATWCEPCKAEMPTLQALHEKHDAKGLKVISISLDGPDTMSGVGPYIRSNGYTFDVVIDEDTSIAGAYNPKATAPYTVIIDKKGKIHKTIQGFQASEAPELVKEIEHLLAAK